ncbi:MAG: sigma-54-dependent Fis family transcriptional regulator [Gammaproteobacteria bacterium CG22_combo_CG10-13_8_21_14_all_40_8]|nr:MAG: sigma-54-dependent Fis family transcriptional regulator [Gammaproteobacteria bacterium CG22_combo_CG10-13_8_21_14_all_40_8]
MSSNQPIALIIDDEPDILQLLSITLGRMNIQTVRAETVKQALQHLSEQTFDLCLTDMRLPDGTGMDIISELQKISPQTPIAMLTAHGNMQMAIEALKLGAFDFVSKPIELPKLRELIQSALQLKKTQPKSKSTQQLIGDSLNMQQLRATIGKVARSQAPVAIFGESGTGKELVARLIHMNGPRHAEPFVPVNCGAIPSELMESELFGHMKGSFTGAINDKPGLFKAAQGGTLFLDEVADLPLHMQVKLLRAIQEKSVRPIGSSQEISCNVRVLCATHKNLGQMVTNGQFRQDLYYRLNVIEIMVPPLRSRKQDIPILTMALLRKINPQIIISPSALNKLEQYDFPGNVRELENILERATTLLDSNSLEADDLMFSSHTQTIINQKDLSLSLKEKENSTASSNASHSSASTPLYRGTLALDEFLEKIERDEITAALESCRWNKTAAAKQLGISFRAMRYKLQKLGLD